MTSPVGQDGTVFVPGPYTYQPLGYAQLTVTGTAQTLKQLLAAAAAASPATSQISDIPTGARMALILGETANVRWIDDGQKPTTTFGTLHTSTQEFQYSGDLNAIQFIAVSGSPVLDVSFYK